MKKVINIYFDRPILIDIIIGLLIIGLTLFFSTKYNLELPVDKNFLSDLSAVGLTISGFIFTTLTVLISFKSSSKINHSNRTLKNSAFDLFFTSTHYYKSINIIKNAVKSLLFFSIIGFAIKIFTPNKFNSYTMFFNVFFITIMGLTLWRCLLIFSEIIKIQSISDKHE